MKKEIEIKMKDEIKRLKYSIWALLILQVIFVPCVLVAINILWASII